MKIALLSDVHLSVDRMAFPDVHADVVVVAGDVARPPHAMEWMAAATRPTLYVVGNHEFYGSDLVTTYERIREATAGTRVRLLERNEWHHEGVRFLGCTLWTDYRLDPSQEARDKGIEDAERMSYDFRKIRIAPDFPATFNAAVSQLVFLQSVAWLEECFARPHPGPTVVVTHHAPARPSIAARFRDSSINASFVSDLSAQIERWQPELWLHGHTHDSFDYRIGRTRVVCNARGYAPGAKQENPRFDPLLTLDLPT